VPKAADVVSLATKLKIHPAPIAGRIRFQHNNYQILSKLVGNGQARNLFPEYAQETATWT
jgi:HTH-type transcriptional regulator/antitoxin HigA